MLIETKKVYERREKGFSSLKSSVTQSACHGGGVALKVDRGVVS